MKIEIKRYDGFVLYTAEAETLAQALSSAIKDGANLTGANLRGANLTGADLADANLHSADLYGANLTRADLYVAYLTRADLHSANLAGANLADANLADANLYGAYLTDAYLSGADLYGANLTDANLTGADLSGANLAGAYLAGAHLAGANLAGADLAGANLYGADLHNAKLPYFQIFPEEGSFVAWKKLYYGVIAKLEIPNEARRTASLVGRKCRAEFVRVLELSFGTEGYSQYDKTVAYRPGEIVRSDKFDDDIRVECSSGIHFFMTRREAEEY